METSEIRFGTTRIAYGVRRSARRKKTVAVTVEPDGQVRVTAPVDTARDKLDEIVQTCLEGAALWKEVKDELKKSALALSGGQQQRLCIARAIATEPQVLLMDEPCSALDPIATAKVEELIDELKQNFSVVIVTHSMQQAARVSQRTAFFHLGSMVEYGDTEDVFTNPREERTQDYITGRFG